MKERFEDKGARYTVMPGIKFSAYCELTEPECRGIYLGPYDTVAELLASYHAARLVDRDKKMKWTLNVEERDQ